MKLIFAGTRGYINARTRRHRMHAALDVTYKQDRARIDFGADWQPHAGSLKADGVLITHAHPDHADGLQDGVPCPVYATEESWEGMQDYPIKERRTVAPRKPFYVGDMRFEAFPVVHSTRAPAVGYRITAGRTTVFYAPDLVFIEDGSAALRDVRLYIGDGATIERSFVRKSGDVLIGHTPVRTQLTWCRKTGVSQAVFTHCGSEIVKGDERTLGALIRRLGNERDVEARIAHDGLSLVYR